MVRGRDWRADNFSRRTAARRRERAASFCLSSSILPACAWILSVEDLDECLLLMVREVGVASVLLDLEDGSVAVPLLTVGR